MNSEFYVFSSFFFFWAATCSYKFEAEELIRQICRSIAKSKLDHKTHCRLYNCESLINYWNHLCL